MNFTASLLFSTANSIFKIVNSAADECRANISKEGISIAVVDLANVAIISLDIPAREFRSYNYIEGVETQIGLPIDETARYLETLSKNGVEDNSEVSISIQPESTDGEHHILQIVCGIYQKTFKCQPLESIRKIPNIPKLEHRYKITIDTKTLKNIVNITQSVDDYIWIGVEQKDGEPSIYFQDGARTFLARPQAYIELQTAEHKDVRSLLSIDYLTDIIPKIPSEYTVVLLNNDWPVVFRFTTGKATACNWMQAPRVISGD